MIELKNITKSFDGRTVVNDVSLLIKDENFVSIVGKSGSGKSTLLNIIGSLEKPDSGSVLIDEKDVVKMSASERAAFRNKKIGFIFQSFFLEPSYDVFHNVAVPLLIAGKKDIEQRVRSVLEQVDMLDYKDKKVVKLSGGEQQRICIARALVNEPEILLADEPCGNLDIQNSKIIMELLRSLAGNGRKVFMVTHDMDDAGMADRMVTISDGKIIRDEKL